MSGLENPLHWLILLVIALIVLGPKRLPAAARSVGQGIREFKDAIAGHHADDEATPPLAEKAGASSRSVQPAPPDEGSSR